MKERRHTILEDKSYEGVEHRDPSANVILLVGQNTKYLEELHKQSDEFYNKKLEQSQAFLDEKLKMAIDTSKRERSAESARIDALREDDRQKVAIAEERAIQQAGLLAKQLSDNTETFRKAMAEQAISNNNMVREITSSLDARLKLVENNQNVLTGASKGGREMYGWIAGGIALVLLIINFFWDKV